MESNSQLRLVEKRNGKVFCSVRKANSASCGSESFADEVVARHVPGDVLQVYLATCRRMEEKRLAQEMELQKQREIKAELDRLTKLDETARKVEQAFRHIANQVLTLRCPRCHTAFIDFSGCFALSCSSCPCNFCGWCLADCGKDAHKHVANCSANQAGRDVFAKKELFEAYQKDRKRNLVLQYLATLGDLRGAVVARCRTEFRDLGLQIN